jgi:diguanylate cyclase (GGDEF)-like protein
MINIIVVGVLLISLFIVIFLGAYTLTVYESQKKKWFIALLCAEFLFLLGYLMTILSGTREEAFSAAKIEYIGFGFLIPLALLFVCDYCEFKLHKAVQSILAVIPTIITVLLWTTENHGLIYSDFEFAEGSPVGRLIITPGPLYYFILIYAAFTMIISLAILLYRYKVWDNTYRYNIKLLIIGICIPLITNIIYIIMNNTAVFKLMPINPTPIFMVASCAIFAVNIVKYQLLDILPKASEMALQSIKEAFILINGDNILLHANETAKKIFPELSAFKNMKNVKTGQIENWPFKQMENESISDSIHFKMPSDNSDNYYDATINKINDKKENLLGYLILIKDVTESVLLTKKLEEIAYTDSLTNIMTRQHFMNLAATQFERAKRKNNDSFVIMFDVDYFKKVNDTYGHSIGDKVLKCVAERVKAEIRPYDLFGRYGGEEFIMFVSDINETDVNNHTERVRQAIAGNPMVFDDIQLTISASFGIASVLPVNNLENAIEIADKALYRAKAEGRNRVVLSK